MPLTAHGTIRWLRPSTPTRTAPCSHRRYLPRPADLPEQMRAVADILSTSAQPLDLDALAMLGRARCEGTSRWCRA